MKRFYLQCHITNECGNRCRHCYIDKYKGCISEQEIRPIFEDLEKTCRTMGVQPFIAITGGDPLMNPDFWSILKTARKIGAHVNVLGNPELIRDKEIERFIEIGIDSFQFSLDGSEKIHDHIRYKGSFWETTNAVSKFSALGIRVGIMTTVSSLNIHDVEEVVRISDSIGASYWGFSRWIPKSGDCGIIPSEYANLIRKVYEIRDNYDIVGEFFHTDDCYMGGCIPERFDPKVKRIEGGCSLGASSLALLHDKTIMACRRHSGSVLGEWSLQKGLLYYFVRHPKMKEYRKIHDIEGCRSCRFLYYCRGCRAAAYASGNGTMGRDPQCPIAVNT